MEENMETPEIPDDDPKGLRAQLNAALAENKDLKADRREAAFAEAGFDVTKGLGKAIDKEYTGVLTSEAVLAYAETEYGHVNEAVSAHPEAGQITAAQERLDQAGQTAGSIPVAPTEAGALAQAEADGDYATTMAIKGNQVAEMMRGNRNG